MEILIGPYDPDTATVPVTFAEGDITHKRPVNACHDSDGAYDAEATAARVNEVALGVAAKIAVGAITNPPPEPEPVVEPTEEPAGE